MRLPQPEKNAPICMFAYHGSALRHRHCHALSDLVVRHDIEVNLRHLDRRIARLEEQAVDMVWGHPELRWD